MKFEILSNKIDENHQDTKDQIDSFIRQQDAKHIENRKLLMGIDAKATTTNGKVRKLEKWQAGLIMAGSTALFLGAVIVGLIVYIYQYQLAQQTIRINNLKAQIQNTQLK